MRRLILLPLLVGLCGPLPAGCSKKKTPEDQIRAVVRQAIEAANKKQAGGVMKLAAEDFKGPRGTDLREARRVLTGYFIQQGWLRVFESNLDVQIEGDIGYAQLEAVLARGNPVENLEDVLPTQASKMRFELTLKQHDGEWKFTQATYQQLAL